MSKDLNQCNFIGRLGRDPEIKQLPNGNSVVNFSIACGDDYKDKQGQKVEQTNWVSCVAFGKLADIISQYVQKGSRIYVSGKQVTRKWQDTQTGADRYATEINVSEMQMLDSVNSGAQNQNQHPQQQAVPQQQGNNFDDDIPFS